jgi:hypothetical protein
MAMEPINNGPQMDQLQPTPPTENPQAAERVREQRDADVERNRDAAQAQRREETPPREEGYGNEIDVYA